MVSPPIITEQFLRACLQYEYLKNKKNVDQVYANICQMMQSECVREEAMRLKACTPSGSAPSDSTGEGPPDAVNTSKRSRSEYPDSSGDVRQKRRREEEQEEDEEHDEQMEEEEDQEGKQKMDEKEKDVYDGDSEDNGDSTPATDPDSEAELGREPFLSLAQGSLLGKNEISVNIHTIKKSTIEFFFKEFGEGLIPKDEIRFEKMGLSMLRIFGYCHERLGDIKNFKHPYNEIKSTIDFHKVKLHLKISKSDDSKTSEAKNSETSEARNSGTSEAKNSETSEARNSEKSEAKNSETSEAKNSETSEAKNSETSEAKNSETSETNTNFHVEHWDDVKGGCWMWSDDNVRFIKDLNYESLAANFIGSYLYFSNMPLESLEFDIEERTKWSPNQDHSAAFWLKIKSICRRGVKIGTKKLSMKVFKCRDRIDCPFRLRLLNVGKVEEIKMRVWDDSYLREDPSRIRYLNYFAQWDQWKNATILDIEDPNLSSINPDNSNFELVKRQSISSTEERNMREFFKKNEEWKKCVVTAKEKFKLNSSDKDENVVSVKMIIENKTYAGSKKFRITIEEFKVTYEMIDSNTPESQEA